MEKVPRTATARDLLKLGARIINVLGDRAYQDSKTYAIVVFKKIKGGVYERIFVGTPSHHD